MNVDHANDHGSFVKEVPIKMSNLCCLGGDTWITVEHSDGSIEDVKIKDAKSGDKVYSRNVMTGKNEFREIKASLMTRENAQVMRITDSETGNSIVCTPDHRVYTKNRGYVEAKDLVETDQLLVE
jgi:intein/homing endonuclease